MREARRDMPDLTRALPVGADVVVVSPSGALRERRTLGQPGSLGPSYARSGPNGAGDDAASTTTKVRGMATGPAIEATGLVKRYDETVALGGVDLDVPRGAVLAMLGPNGAGKTTTVRILTTLTSPTEGSARVAGFDVVQQAHEVRRRIGLAAQDATVDQLLT